MADRALDVERIQRVGPEDPPPRSTCYTTPTVQQSECAGPMMNVPPKCDLLLIGFWETATDDNRDPRSRRGHNATPPYLDPLCPASPRPLRQGHSTLTARRRSVSGAWRDEIKELGIGSCVPVGGHYQGERQ
ncbi:unnamed protein product [Boreogadus saida]